ncbi:ATP-binding protein [Archangium gephyra]|nr:ATP-binding protein [Archangium gephyra]
MRVKQLAARPFLLGKQLAHEENRYCEFKEVKGNNPIASIHSLADQYVVAYLNAEGRGKAGRILWGIKDDGVVVGVKLTQGMRDELRRVITESLLKIEPPLAPTEYRIDLHAVYEQGGKIQDLFVVEIVVPIATHKYLYSTGNGEVYIKTDAGKKRLRPIELQEEILKRHKAKS